MDTPIITVSNASCQGGVHPEPPLHYFPLLAWAPGHERHGDSVFTEDQKASVDDIALEMARNPNIAAVAARFGTTVEHVVQAMAYAQAATKKS